MVHELVRDTEAYYAAHGRHDLPWRQIADPYAILVSELMLQQTQVARVIPKYGQFLELFPAVHDLAAADLADVLRAWQGLGYNRRAKYLWQAAGKLVHDYDGIFPQDITELVKLPGVGKNTAGAVTAYAYNQPVVFIETNVRTVVIHHFFHDQTDISDADIAGVLPDALAATSLSPREFYWALMDYGTHLKAIIGNLNKLSKNYTKQSTFHGSRRQVRGAVLRLLTEEPKTRNMLRNELPDERLESVLGDLAAEGLVQFDGKHYHL